MSNPSSTQLHIVILGGGYAGLTLAQRLSQQKANVTITLIDAKPEFQQRIRLQQVAAGQAVQTFPYKSFLEPLGVQFVLAQVTSLDPTACILTIQHANGSTTTLPYDYLAYALGSVMDVDRVPGVREHAHAFHSIKAAQGVYAALEHLKNARVLVVGGGLTGIETTAELVESFPNLRASLAIDKPLCEDEVPGGFNRQATSYLYRAFEKRNIMLRTGARVQALHSGMAQMSDGGELAFDVCIWTSGFIAQPLARDAGIQVNQLGQIETDAALRSRSHPNIIAIGDAAQAHTPDAGGCRMGSATALAMATAAARTLSALLAGKAPADFRFVYLFRNISLGRHDGVVQFVDRRDVPRTILWTGRTAAAWKEYICQSTLSTIGLCSSAKLPALPPIRTLPQLLQGMQQYA